MDLLKTTNNLLRAETEFDEAEALFKKAAVKYTAAQHEFDEAVATLRNRWYRKLETPREKKE